MWAYAQVGMLLQWALVGLFGLYVIKLIWPDLNDAFGIIVADQAFMADTARPLLSGLRSRDWAGTRLAV